MTTYDPNFMGNIFNVVEKIEKRKYEDRFSEIEKLSSSFYDRLKPIFEKVRARRSHKTDQLDITDVILYKDVFGNGPHEHFNRIRSMEKYAKEDLTEIVKTEMEGILGCRDHLARLTDFMPTSYLVLRNEDKIDKLIHSYFTRLSTLIDNVYHLVADFYSLDINGNNIRESVDRQLGAVNKRLKDHLKNSFYLSKTQKKFNITRNKLLHEAPSFKISSNFDSKNPSLRYRFSILFQTKDSKQHHKLFDYLVSFYKHVQDSTVKVIELMIK